LLQQLPGVINMQHSVSNTWSHRLVSRCLAAVGSSL